MHQFKSIRSTFRNCLRSVFPFQLRRRLLRAIGRGSSQRSPQMVTKAKLNLFKTFQAQEGSDQQNRKLVGDERNQGKVTIIIPTRDNLEQLKLCVDSIFKNSERQDFRIIIVDNGSKQHVLEYLLEQEHREPRLRSIFNNKNLGFSGAINTGLRNLENTDYVILLNDDTIVTNGWITGLIQPLEDPTIALTGPVSNFVGNEAQIEAKYDDPKSLELFSHENHIAHMGEQFDIPMLAMYCVCFRKALVDEIGYLDDRFSIGMFEDDDYSLRVHRAGGRTVCVKDVFIHHWGMTTFNRMKPEEYDRLFDENRRKFEDKWDIKWLPTKKRD